MSLVEPAEARGPQLIAERYAVEEKLGEGGMGAIYRVFDAGTERHVALKLTKGGPEGASNNQVASLQREYYTLKQLAHPRIIRVYDYGVSEDGPYYTMELLDGQDLRALAPVAPQRACAILRDVASSLAIIHSRRLVYRDLNPHNVRCTGDGRAKLLDFGALTPVGIPRQVIGTAAFAPPEVVYGQPLDQRSDLYSLGVLAYWLLTGKRPYDVRRFRDLRDAWRSKPPRLSSLCAEIPAALDALVTSLLSHSPAGRPQHAAEVIDRLTTIGGLPRDPDVGVTRAYLTTPQLVGRSAELIRIRKALVRSTRGRGCGLLVRAEPGAGSTRFVDACVMEAKLVGVLVARADASLVGHGAFAALREVIEQWSTALPPAAAQSMRSVLAHVGLDESVHARIAADLLTCARDRALLLAVDDAHRIDAGSLAVFALLAQAARDHKLIVCAALPTHVNADDSIPLRMLDAATRRVELRPWTLEQTESLLQSVFGDVPNVPLLADRIQRVARGNPRDTMQLAQHLVDTEVVRHQTGGWLLPTKLDEVVLPSSMAQAQRHAIDLLDAGSRALAATLALAPDLQDIDLARCSRLSTDALTHLDELLRRGVLMELSTGVAFRHGAFATALIGSLDAEDRATCHVSLAAMHEASGDHALTVAYHLHRAGRHAACWELVRPCLDMNDDKKFLRRHQLDLLEEIVSDPGRYPLTALETHLCQTVLVRHAATIDPHYGRYGEPSFERLRRDTGLVYWNEHEDLDGVARIGRCLQRAQEVYEATNVHERGLAPVDAIRALAILVRSMTSVYARTLAADQLIGLAEWLAPFRALAPVLDLLHELTLVSTDRAVREKRVAHRFLACAARFEDAALGLDETVRLSAASICTYCAAMDEAKQGKPSALTRAEQIEKVPSFAALAWHVRMLTHIYSGNTAEASQCRQRMELLVIQQDEPNTLLAMSVLYEAWGYEMCEDLTGLKVALQRVEQEAEKYSGWAPWAVLYAGDVHRLRGAVDVALSCYERAAAMTAAGKHQVWPHATERKVVALRQLGRFDESLELGRMLVQFGEAEDLEPVNLLRFYTALALSEAEAGLLADAAKNIERAHACAQREQIGGVPLGIVYEAEARVAIRNRDVQGFQAASQRCASYLLPRHNPALTAKHERLLLTARAAGLESSAAERRDTSKLHSAHPVFSKLAAMADDDARANLVLDTLTTHYGVETACLFGMTSEGARAIALIGDAPADERLRARVDAYLSAELISTEVVTATLDDERAAAGGDPVWTIDRDLAFLPVLLQAHRDHDELISGVALLRVKDASLPLPPGRDLLQALAQALLLDRRISGMRADL